MPTENRRIILPTHTCFDDAIEYIHQRVIENPKLVRGRRLRLVHAVALMPPEQADADAPFAHAWVEENAAHCITAGLLGAERVIVKVSRAEFYGHLRVRHATYYTVRQMYRENLRSEHHGPWLEVYARLCRDRDAVVRAAMQQGT